MPIKFNCHCGKKLVARSAMAGKQIRCPECNDLLLLPKINIGKPLEKKREPKQVPIVSNAPPQIPPTNPNEPRFAGQPATPQANAPLSSSLDRPPSNNLGNPPAAPIAHPMHYEAPKDVEIPAMPQPELPPQAQPVQAQPVQAQPVQAQPVPAQPVTPYPAGPAYSAQASRTQETSSSPIKGCLVLSLAFGIPLVAVLAAIGIWIFATGQNPNHVFGEPQNSLDLSYLPADTYRLEYQQVAAALDTQAGRDLLNRNAKYRTHLESIQLNGGIDYRSVESITIGFRNPQNRKELPGGVTMTTSGILEYSGVIRFRDDMNEALLLERIKTSSKMEHAGKTYYRLSHAPAPHIQGGAIYFADSQTLVFGTEREVKAAIESGGRQERQKGLDSIDTSAHFIVASIEDENGDPLVFGESLILGTDLEFVSWIECGSRMKAEQVKANQDLVLGFANRVPEKGSKNSSSSDASAENLLGQFEVEGTRVVCHRRGSQAKALSQIPLIRLAHFLPPILQANVSSARPTDSAPGKTSTTKNRPAKNPDFRSRVEKSSREQVAALPAATPGTGKKIDLLHHFRNRYVVKGDWQKAADGNLVCRSRDFVPRVQFPYKPPEEYDFIAVFKQPNLRNHVGLIMPNGHYDSFTWQVGGPFGDFAFSVDGSRHNQYRKKFVRYLQPNREHTMMVQVRKDGVTGIIDGKVVSRIKTDFKNLKCDRFNKLPDDEFVGISCDDPTVFSRIEIIEVTGQGQFSLN